MYGGKPLCGEIEIQGSKNAALPILAATILIDGITILHNCPKILDIFYMVKILESLGCSVLWEGHRIQVDARPCKKICVPEEYAGKMRSSVIFLGPLLAKKKEAFLPYPGGCVIGTRPIDLHMKALSSMNIFFKEEGPWIHAKGEPILGGNIVLDFPSVGATENIVLASVLANGITRLENAAMEPEITELCCFLTKAGAKIPGIGTSVLEIQGVKELKGVEHTIEADRIVAGTYLFAALGTRGQVLLQNAPVGQMRATLEIAQKMGALLCEKDGDLFVDGKNAWERLPYIKTEIYPGFPTDLQSPLLSVLSVAKGNSIVEETIFESRFKVVEELRRLGASMEIEGRQVIIHGKERLNGCCLKAQELRGGAALVIAGLIAKGKTRIIQTQYIKRGYEDICRDLKALGANIFYS